MIDKNKPTDKQNDRIISNLELITTEWLWLQRCKGVEINAVTYQDLVLEPVVKYLGANMFGNQPILF